MKVKPLALFVAALVSASLLGGCSTVPASGASSAQVQGAVKLADHNWDSFNKAQIEKMIAIWEAFTQKYADWKLCIYGAKDGDYFEKIQQLVQRKKLEDKIIFKV